MARYGLIGRNIDYSFSRGFFNTKFEQEGLEHEYLNFDLQDLEELPAVKETAGLAGLNVTIPYKESIIPLLNGLDREAEKIGAVNTIKILSDGRWIGYNTDHYGFARSLSEQGMTHQAALVLGSGGASKAIGYVLDSMGIAYRTVSRNPEDGQLSYTSLDKNVMNEVSLIINTTPLGTHPNTEAYPPIPYAHLHAGHLLFDLIYNPPITAFMNKGLEQGCKVVNGQKMLEYQALKAWSVWNS